ncbi:hypothetical protein DV736_g5299, partial [Chaetothyriales sp. CBS 134916]
PVKGTGNNYSREGDSEDSANPTTTAFRSVQPGVSQDNPIVLDNDQRVNTYHDDIVLDGERPTYEGTDLVYPGDESPSFPGGYADSGRGERKNTPDYLAKYNMDNGTSHAGSGIDSDAPASVGQIHDVFAEYEETFGLSKSKRKAARSTLRNCPENETTVDSIPHGIIQGEPRDGADDGATNVEQAAEAAGDGSTCLSKRDIENESILRSRIEINGQETETLGAKFPSIPAMVGDHRSENISTSLQHPLLSPPLTPEDAIGSDPGTVTQATRTRKQYSLSTKSSARHDTGTPQKRPRCAMKETWKAKEAREARKAADAKQSLVSSRSSCIKQAHIVYRAHSVGAEDNRVAEIEDIYLGEDSSI